ncbi:chromosome segregation protein SMC [Pandoraea sputorum]|uniref:Chromosome partition protein Smc n=1 Tax=Pandoraea sputorum TaxID=93222 RepID=A0A239SJI9_9BURK|nr:chromosome segregation protein SMC [Pandoraea sputorum]AJC17311.1 chromosome segregation protein SMC [Pandoraea sputorum]SNU85590.1 Chromosome partition protein Smc [Pandoraea sputorum]VVE37650.1 Chromosome partition protein Smc [Pandoraea sputorum]VVE74169.1 Chromosome partition protein Smc [Pandoraea sputorum]BET09635.1 chromosome segregation protein SMC [Pandoraea sputorum]
MRLTSIKLAGFKSFVDPTNFAVPGQLVGIVGPNGCGKSNIIDAVRWVLGESRASELRGESMQDVIFNGSTARKQASRASVELVFDNSAGRAAGQWSQYAEIAVKRVLTRDGTSSYYINNLPARRRDIQDIFLGTGLGPRAYAIIGQGMISRIIEAKPEELRVFLEEAAGVSKYKERRRETENRLQDTRENLTRVEDILRELGTNLEKLESQAVVANRFKDLQRDGEEKQQLLWLLRKNEAQNEQERQQRAIESAQVDLEAQMSRLRGSESDLETLRAAHYTATDAVQAAQSAMYEANSEVSRLEAEIRYVVESRNRVQAQLAALTSQREQWQARSAQSEEELALAEEELIIAEERAATAQDQAADQNEALPALESGWRDAQNLLNEQRSEIAQVEQSLKLEAAHQRNADQALQQLQQRQERLQGEARGLDKPDEAELEMQRGDLAEHQAMLEDAQAELADAEERLPRLEAERAEAQARVQSEAATIAQLEARLTALKQLQESVQTEGKVQPWLDKHELAQLPRLWKKLHIEPGWEPALESVLRERLAALEISNLDWVKAFASDAPPAKLAFYSPPPAARPMEAPASLRPLLSLLRIDDPGLRAVLQEWLGHVFVADDLAQAMVARAQLPEGASIVVKAGHQVTRVGVQLYAADSEQAGLLARQQEIENLGKQLRAQALLSDEAKSAAVRAEAAYSQAAQSLSEVRGRAERATQRVHALQMDVLKLTQAYERYNARSTQIDEELREIAAQIEEQLAMRAESEANFEQSDARLAELQATFEDGQLEFESLDSQLSDARNRARELERLAQEASYGQKGISSKIDEHRRSIQTALEQAERLVVSIEQAQAELALITEQTAENGLQDALELRAEKEEILGAARIELDALTQKLRQSDEERLAAERGLQPLRDRITELQLKEQAARLNREQFVEQLTTAEVDEEALSAKLTADMKPSYLQGEVTRINNAINALGPVNMAALEELETARERKVFLDAQSADLNDAIETLEGAIRKIDEETRVLLQGTFDEVNKHFGELFPMLFGGGQAKLIMTGDEILDAGVQVMAQPPGKKNSTIHLLSGGEKALTAIALVFGMFQLNPAPFCLLDEVDAPLDDANTERYAKMVARMSDRTQFVFISHNKIAMEMANQLIGVTMQEQGVSRIVAVDMESAINLAEIA